MASDKQQQCGLWNTSVDCSDWVLINIIRVCLSLYACVCVCCLWIFSVNSLTQVLLYNFHRRAKVYICYHVIGWRWVSGRRQFEALVWQVGRRWRCCPRGWAAVVTFNGQLTDRWPTWWWWWWWCGRWRVMIDSCEVLTQHLQTDKCCHLLRPFLRLLPTHTHTHDTHIVCVDMRQTQIRDEKRDV